MQNPPHTRTGLCQSVSGAQLQQGMGRISPLLCPPPPTHPSPPTNLPSLPASPPLIFPPIHPTPHPLAGRPSFPLALIMDFLQIMWFILVMGRPGVRLVKAVHFCHFNSYCMGQGNYLTWQENICLWWHCTTSTARATVCLLIRLSLICLICTYVPYS